MFEFVVVFGVRVRFPFVCGLVVCICYCYYFIYFLLCERTLCGGGIRVVFRV